MGFLNKTRLGLTGSGFLGSRVQSQEETQRSFEDFPKILMICKGVEPARLGGSLNTLADMGLFDAKRLAPKVGSRIVGRTGLPTVAGMYWNIGT